MSAHYVWLVAHEAALSCVVYDLYAHYYLMNNDLPIT
jgi:hypothetical protein